MIGSNVEVSNVEIRPTSGPKITLADCKDQITKETYFVEDTLTICVLTLKNGFKVTGECAAVSVENFDQAIGEALSKQRAVEKIWPLLGYVLRNELAQAN